MSKDSQSQAVCSNCKSRFGADPILEGAYKQNEKSNQEVGEYLDSIMPIESDEKFEVEEGKKVFKVVGRVDQKKLEKYKVTVQGRKVVDYDKLASEEPALYDRVLKAERIGEERHRLDMISIDYGYDRWSILKHAKCPNCGREGTLRKARGK